MKFSIKLAQPEKFANTCILLSVDEKGRLSPIGQQIDKQSKSYLSKLIKQGAFTGSLGTTLNLLHIPNTKYAQVLLVGCGNTNELTPSIYKKLIICATKALCAANVTQAYNTLTELNVAKKSAAWKCKLVVEAMRDACYRFDLFKTSKESSCPIKEVTLALPDAKALKACELAVKQGTAIANGVTLTKNLANTPSNICTPSFLAQQAKALAKSFSSIKVKVLDEKEMKKLGMGALLGVSQGSAEEAQLICLEYKGTSKKSTAVALVGKGVTFDTGGNSLKSPDAMVGMKYDMCGAASVLGTLQAIATLKLPINVVGVIAAVENMPGGTAYKPEDILTSMSGQTIEVISTDAEGRLALADALTYCERYSPEVVIDIATLTGAVVIALGHHATGLVTNHDPLAAELLKAGEESVDRAWQLPLWQDYQEQIKSPFADIANTGGRAAGTITAGCFLSRFAKKFQWAHLDVAGTAAMMAGTAERMATGRPVPMLVQFLIDKSMG